MIPGGITYEQAIAVAHDLNQPEFDNPEYLRGQAELIAGLFPVRWRHVSEPKVAIEIAIRTAG